MVKNKGLSALAQAEAVRYRLFEGLSVRRAAYSVLKFIMDRGAKGVEVTVSGKLRGQRAKSMKFRDGYMLHAGDAVNYYIDSAVKHVLLRQGVIGIKVKIMLPHDPTNEWGGPVKDLPDVITIHPPKELESTNLPLDAAIVGGSGGGRPQGYYQSNIPAATEIDRSQYTTGPLGMQQQGGLQSQQQQSNVLENVDQSQVLQQQSGGVSGVDQFSNVQQQGVGGYDPSFQANQQFQSSYDQPQDQSFDQYNQYGQQGGPQQQGGYNQQYDFNAQQDPQQQQGGGGGGGGYYNPNQGYYNPNQNYRGGGQGGQGGQY